MSPVPVKLIAGVAWPFKTDWAPMGSTDNNGFIVAVTVSNWVAAPPDERLTSCDILPAGADEVERTYITVLFTVPAVCLRIILLLYPLPGLREI